MMYLVIAVLIVVIIVQTYRIRELTTSSDRIFLMMDILAWRLASLARLITATEDDSLINLADQILTAERGDRNE